MPQFTVDQIEQAFGRVAAKLAREDDIWPDAAETQYRLDLIAEHGKGKLKGILAARRRYNRHFRQERYREAGFAPNARR